MKKYALISVSNKTGIVELAKKLIEQGYQILSTGGTYNILYDNLDRMYIGDLVKVSDYTGFPEILGGRVKTLHPKIYGGILCDTTNKDHLTEIEEHDIGIIDTIVVNLYPFKEITSKDECTLNDAIENIDIGGPTLVKSGLKNFKCVTILCDSKDYAEFMMLDPNKIYYKSDIEIFRTKMAVKAINHITDYNIAIAEYYAKTLKNKIIGQVDDIKYRKYTKTRNLKYGCNPHQKSSIWSINDTKVPFKVVNGNPGFINYLDAISAWSIVTDIQNATSMITTVSMKHTSVTGCAVSKIVNKDTPLFRMFDVPRSLQEQVLQSPIAIAYLRALNADPMSAFGNFIGISSKVDLVTAKLIKTQVSDGIIAPGYTPEALAILKAKKGGKYVILEGKVLSSKELRQLIEFRELYGFAMSQDRNNTLTTEEYFKNIVTITKDINESDKLNMTIANIVLKWTQSNSIAYATDGTLIALQACQQNRVDCVRLAGNKARIWQLRQSKSILEYNEKLKKEGVKRQQRINNCLAWINTGDVIDTDYKICLASDAFFPFRDSIDVASHFNISCIIQPGGSTRDQEVIDACNEHGISMCTTGVRVFYH